jgi:hypothetical protein
VYLVSCSEAPVVVGSVVGVGAGLLHGLHEELSPGAGVDGDLGVDEADVS